MIAAILLGLRTAGALGCGIFAIVAQLIMIFVFNYPWICSSYSSLNYSFYWYCWGTLQSTGGIDYLVYLASKVIEKYPKSIIFISPIIVFIFVLVLVLRILLYH